jgi:hypothetical protein
MVVSQFHRSASISAAIGTRVMGDISSALDEYLICNDSKWFNFKGNRLKPCVKNQAEYLSKKFQANLNALGWQIEKVIDDQRIDSFVLYPYEGEFLQLNKLRLMDLISKIDPDDPLFLPKVSDSLSLYRRKSPIVANQQIAEENDVKYGKFDVRIGLEFETGNIASSFRAIGKLNFLYETGQIDIGVFVTCSSKDDSTRIWPSSNRNGSLTELNNRKFLSQIKFPSIVAGFKPDGYSRDADYLGRTGSKYRIPLSTEEFEMNGKRYRYATDKESCILLE